MKILNSLRDEFEESLSNPSYQQTNSSSYTNIQITEVPVPTTSQSQVPTRSQSIIPTPLNLK